MSRLGFVVAGALLLASTSAYAQIGPTIGTTPTGSLIDFSTHAPLDPANLPSSYFLTGTGSLNDGGAGHYQTDVSVGDTISFKAANLTMGPSLSTVSSTTVSFDFHNPASVDALAGDGGFQFESTIIPAAMGFQVIDLSPSAGCASFDQCGAAGGSANFGSFGFPGAEATFTLGQVGFNFDISDNGESLYNVSGVFELQYGPGGVFLDDANLYATGTGAAGKLDGFHRIGDLNADSQFRQDANEAGFAWDMTGVNFTLFGADHHLTYTTSVFSYVDRPCLVETSICLVGYSGFGDPIGRGGGADALSAFGFSALASDSAVPGGASFNRPTFVNGVLSFTSTDAGVPEPATWMTMILGFGVLGAALRRRRVLAHI